MKVDNYACANIIAEQFKRLNQTYIDMIDHLNETERSNVLFNDCNKWLNGENADSPTKLLGIYYFIWDDVLKLGNSAFENEIADNLFQSNRGYFDYLNNAFAKYWFFIKDLKDPLLAYVNNYKSAETEKIKLYEPPEKFSKNDFKRLVEIDIIQMFDIWETLYKKYYPAYNRYFNGGEFSQLYKTNPNFIDLGYGESNTKAINIMYNSLIGYKYISCSLNEFAEHFDPFAFPVPKLLEWHGSDAQLLVLLMGKNFGDDNDDLPKGNYQLTLNREVTVDQILKNFKLSDTTTTRTLSSNYANIYKRRTIKNSRPIKLLIHDLNIMQTRGAIC